MSKRYVIYNPQGGTEGHSQQYATNLCNGLAGNGVAVNLVTSRDFDATEVAVSGVDVTYTAIHDSRRWTVRYDSWMSKLRYGAFILANNVRSLLVLDRTLRTKPGVCVLVGGETTTNIVYLLASYWRHASVMALTIHNADYEAALYRNDKVKLLYKLISKAMVRLLLKTRVVVFVHGEAMQEALARQLGVRTERFSIYKVPAKITATAEVRALRQHARIRLLFCGVVRQDKGFDILCEALSRCASLDSWELRIAGSVRQVGDNYVQSLTRKFGIDGNCSYNLKYLSSIELDSEFERADIVVLPYRKGFIAQSVVMTDAVRWKRPVIATDHSQNGYDAQKFRVGWVFTSEEVRSLVNAINSAIAELSAGTAEFGFAEFIQAHSPLRVARSIIEQTSLRS